MSYIYMEREKPIRREGPNERAVVRFATIAAENHGAMAPEYQTSYDAAVRNGDFRRAFVIVERWFITNLPRAEQLAEIEGLQSGIAYREGLDLEPPWVVPEDLLDLLKEE